MIFAVSPGSDGSGQEGYVAYLPFFSPLQLALVSHCVNSTVGWLSITYRSIICSEVQNEL